MEYRIVTELLSSNGLHTVIDLLRLDNKDNIGDLCTFGDYYVNDIGENIPLDKVLTVKIEQCSKELLDYIFHLKVNEPQQQQQQQNI